MGVWASRMLKWAVNGFEDDPANICMLGLDAAGKTTITYKLKLNELVTTIPTIGFNVETIKLGKGITMTIWDIGGQQILRPLWRHYYANCRGLVYVVDSSDRQRLNEARDELHTILKDTDMIGVPVVVLANKQDLPGAVSTAELIDKLQLRTLPSCHQWYVQATCATTGDGLYEGLYQMANYAKAFRKEPRLQL